MKLLTNCIFFSILTLIYATLAHGNECNPALTGAPCAKSGLASYAQAEPSLNVGAGNPINLITGNKYQLAIDLPANPSALGIELIRHYNSNAPANNFIGHGWKLSYDTRLYKINDSWQIAQADGSRVVFSKHDLMPDGSHKNQYGQLSHVNNRHHWLWHSGGSFEFDENGFLTSIQFPSLEQLYIQRYEQNHALAGAIKQIINVHEQTMLFHYNQNKLISHIDTPIGKFSYKYDDLNRLHTIIRPDGMQQKYYYLAKHQSGNLYSLTGIGIQQSHNDNVFEISLWTYDKQNRAISYTDLTKKNSHKNIKIDYQKTPSVSENGITVVSNHLKQKTYFITAQKSGKYVLKNVKGAGCYGCIGVGTTAKYDNNGRITYINGTKIKRYDNGLPKEIHLTNNNWNNLRLSYSQLGLLQSWQSNLTGKTHITYNNHGLPITHLYANGDTTDISYDAFKRPQTIIEKNSNETITTQLQWHGNQLISIKHPIESETRHYDKLGRLIKRDVSRPTLKLKGASDNRDNIISHAYNAITYSEAFAYDEQNRMTHHQLPEGGSIQYKWGKAQQLKAIYWQDINGKQHTIIDSTSNQPGYFFGNSFKFDAVADDKHRLRLLRLSKANPTDSTVWSQQLSYDDNNRIKIENFIQDQQSQDWVYAYDSDNRLKAIAKFNNNIPVKQQWYAWDKGGIAIASHNKNLSKTYKPKISYDSSGLPNQIDDYKLSYSANRRLKSVQKNNQTIAKYTHNAYGFKVSNQGINANTNYFYLNNQLVAQSNNTHIEKRYIYANLVPVAMIEYHTNQTPELFYIHADAQGAPRIISDKNQKIRWKTQYSEFGYAHSIQGDIDFDLRLPGQIYDANTGLHDNLLRTYDPMLGQYLEPDPLGPIPLNQTYGYANQQPRQYADPMGLLLFAFDGTRQSIDTKSNVWKFTQYYLDGTTYYHQGPGSSETIDWDAITATQAHKIIENQWQNLLQELANTRNDETIPIDIIGFSRGAALARHFGNQIGQYVNQGLFEYQDTNYGLVSACVDLRFMGLFDSVAQFGIAGSQNHLYDLSINSAWEWVAHAVALNEHRWLFPLLTANDNGAYNVVQAPFIGAHSDIGGGVFPENIGKPGGRGDLSKVALNWMLWQGHAASVNFLTVSDNDITINQPIIHDYRSNLIRTIQNGDRAVQSSDGKPMLSYQDDHEQIGRSTRQQTEQFIQREPNWRSQSNSEVGNVDMDGYTEWLAQQIGWQPPL